MLNDSEQALIDRNVAEIGDNKGRFYVSGFMAGEDTVQAIIEKLKASGKVVEVGNDPKLGQFIEIK